MTLIDKLQTLHRGIDTIREWLGSEDGLPVDNALAQQRADTCLKCPNNVQGGIVTGTVAEAVKRHLEVKNKLGLRVQGEKALGRCSVCSCELRLKIWVPIGIVRRHMMPGEWEQFPTPCFQRDEQP